jgi:hypothetical protein
MMVLLPNFIIPYRFSKNKRRFDIIPLPKGWGTQDRIIFISCENDRDVDVFRLADVARQARNIIQNCVEGGITPYGGIEGVESVGSFYVSVGKPTDLRAFSTSELLRGLDLGRCYVAACGGANRMIACCSSNQRYRDRPWK